MSDILITPARGLVPKARRQTLVPLLYPLLL